MEVEFRDDDLDRLETDARFTNRLPVAVVRGYRKVLNWIRQAKDERDLRAMKSLRFERLKGARKHQYSMRLNIQYRLIVEIRERKGHRTVVVVAIEDYH